MKNIIIFTLMIASAVSVSLAHPMRATANRTVVSALEPKYDAVGLASHAQLVVLGRLTAPKTWTDTSTDTPVVLTDWTVQPMQTLKGTAPKKLTMTVMGGTTGGQQVVVDSAPTLKSGATMLLYLTYEASQDRWVPVSITQGVLTPQNGTYVDGRGQKVANNDIQQALKSVGTAVTPIAQ